MRRQDSSGVHEKGVEEAETFFSARIILVAVSFFVWTVVFGIDGGNGGKLSMGETEEKVPFLRGARDDSAPCLWKGNLRYSLRDNKWAVLTSS